MIVGTAGHIDHGKTALIRALTGVETDRLKEEKARGISIELGFAYLSDREGTRLGFVDVPGHEKFVHTMLAGATGIDFALLVIAADDGIMPQTREHLTILDLLGLSAGLVAVTKCDKVGPERLAEVAAEAAALVASTRLAGAAIVPVSALTGEGIDDLRARLFAAAGAFGARRATGAFRLAVDRSFTLAGAGTVVTGTVLSGTVGIGDRVIVSPSGLGARVRAIHAQNVAVERGRAGDRCALNLAGEGVSKDAVARGDVVLDPALHAPAARIDAALDVLASEPRALAQWMPVRLHHAAADIGARLVLIDEAPAVAGAHVRVQLVLDRPIAAAVGDRFVLRDTTAQRTMAGGTMLDLRGPARKRRTPERMAQLDALGHADPAAALEALLAVPPHHVDLTAFARDHALGDAEREAIAARLGLVRGQAGAGEIVLSSASAERFRAGLVAALAAYHQDNPDLPGIGLERLRMQSEPRLPAPAFKAFLRPLAAAGTLALDGAWVRLASHEVKLSAADEAAWERIAGLIGGAERFKPPRVRDIAGLTGLEEAHVRRLAKLAGRLGRVDEIAHDHFFLRSAVGEIVAIIVDIAAAAPRGEFIAAQLRDRLDNGRKVAIQILEFFDRHGVTFRRGDLRRINPHRLDLFGQPAEDSPTRQLHSGRESSPVGRPDFKSGRGREPVSGGFDSLSPPPFPCFFRSPDVEDGHPGERRQRKDTEKQ